MPSLPGEPLDPAGPYRSQVIFKTCDSDQCECLHYLLIRWTYSRSSRSRGASRSSLSMGTLQADQNVFYNNYTLKKKYVSIRLRSHLQIFVLYFEPF